MVYTFYNVSGGYIIHCVVCNYTPYTDVRYTFKHVLDKRNTWFITKRMMTGQKSQAGKGSGDTSLMTMIRIGITANAGNAVRIMVIPRPCFYIMQFIHYTGIPNKMSQNVSKKIPQGNNATV